MKEACRELDALVAEKVMGWQVLTPDETEHLEEVNDCMVVVHPNPYGVMRYVEKSYNYYGYVEWHPSTDIAAAWQVVERMRELGWFSSHTDLTIDSGQEWWSWHFTDIKPPGSTTVKAQGHTAPHAICLAALAAVGADV